jgi:hypothetical protein
MMHSNIKESRTVNILIIDDDDIDAKSIQRAIRDLRIANPV